MGAPSTDVATSARAAGGPGSAPDRPELSIVMPCLNEAETLGTCIDKVTRAIERLGVTAEIVVADNGSSDGSQRIAAERGARVVAVAEPGYGAALRDGIASAQGRWVIMGDADDSYDFGAIDPFVAELRGGHQVVAGNRFAGGIRSGAMPWLHKLGNPLLTRIARRFFGVPVRDIYCGLRGFDRDAVLALDLRSTGMEFAIEMVVKASLYGLSITEVPTTLSPDGRSRKPHLRTWRDGWRSLRFLLVYSPNWLFLYPGLILSAAGVAGLVWRLVGAAGAASVVLFAVLTMVGVQSVLFSVFAKLFAMTERLLPPDPRMTRLFPVVKLETGLLAAFAVLLAGVGIGAGAAVAGGDDRIRLALAAATVFVVGCQLVLASFFLSILGLSRTGNPLEPVHEIRRG